jgi:polygalacturonase
MNQRKFNILLAGVLVIIIGIATIIAARGGTADQIASVLRFNCSASGASAEAQAPVAGLNSTGSSDDTAVIQHAIDIAGQKGGGVVALPRGTFLIDGHLIMRTQVKLTGVGPATVLKAGPGFLAAQSPSHGYPIISTYGADDVTISNLTADQSANTLYAAMAARLAGYVVEGRYSRNVLINDVYVRNPFTYSIAMVRSTNFCVEHCHITASTSDRYNQLDGIHILDSNSGQVIYNVVQSGEDGLVAHTIGAPVYNVLYAGNDVLAGKNSTGLQLAVGDFPIYAITVADNDFHGSLYGIRTGYYDSRAGALYDIEISRNYIHNLSKTRQSPAIEIGGFGGLGPIRDVKVTNTQKCAAGAIIVPAGQGDVVRGTSGCNQTLPS